MRFVLVCMFAVTAVSCTRDYVKVDTMALGRVVVYRNGVAYFERRARLDGEQLSLSVPRDKVDDFLKSLTARDAATGASLPVAFPSPGESSGDMVDMTVRLPGAKVGTEVILTYITEAPAWKPSYRVVLGDDDSVRLEGWAIVDNTSGENWDDVLVGVGSSSALSFRYDLWSIRSVARQTLAGEEQFALAPPRGASPFSTERAGVVVTELTDDQIPRPDSHPEGRAVDEELSREVSAPVEAYAGAVDSGGGGAAGTQGKPATPQGGTVARAAKPAPDPARARRLAKRRAEAQRRRQRHAAGKKRVAALVEQMRKNPVAVTLEGNAGPGEPVERGIERAHTLRNQLVEAGIPPAQLRVRGVPADEGRPAGVRIVADAPAPKDAEPANAPPVGESHFSSGTPMSVQRGSSVMVSILDAETVGRVVYLYDPSSARGNRRYAFKAVRLENPTDNTLETGPVTVYGDGRFIGEGLADPIPPSAPALIPFALDRQVVIEAKRDTGDRMARLVSVSRGAFTTEVQHLRTTELRLTNRRRVPVTVYVRHAVADGWELTEAPERRERVADAYLFPVELKGGETRALRIEEATPLTKTLDVRAPAALDMLSLYLEGTRLPELSAAVAELKSLRSEISANEQAIASLRVRLRDYRVRMDELHAQIITLEAVESSGTSLLRHLRDKSKDISERVHRGTIELVEREQALMMARIRFQDAVAEMTLEGSAVRPSSSR